MKTQIKGDIFHDAFVLFSLFLFFVKYYGKVYYEMGTGIN